MRLHPLKKHGFTLVEMLVVVGIIAVLAAILVPTIASALRRAKVAQIAFDVSNLETAITNYASATGDNPPDFSDQGIVQRHLEKAYRRANANERAFALALAGNVNTGKAAIIDPAEALVFWLGGLSKDERRPFTGPGGPILWVDADTDGVIDINFDEISYNPSRENAYFPFEQQRLSLKEVTVGGGIRYHSNDESTLHSRTDDVFPVFSPPSRPQPYVYFDSRTYLLGISGVPSQTYPSILTGDYVPPAALTMGVARPYLTTNRDPNFFNASTFNWRAHYAAEPKEYQIISAGLDGDYGADWNPAGLKIFETGALLRADQQPWGGGTARGYQDGDLDNITNFSEGTLGDRLP
ncbi:MAG TPA: hypothetical protein DCY79_09280 [Planctomycetaceae bacterium]|mgnify:CR=1 FL=1|nr:hypothetical protein [Blastopirellula sp.]HAY79979.1 hypothetical protein [Planctomycetaceae bacterium]